MRIDKSEREAGAFSLKGPALNPDSVLPNSSAPICILDDDASLLKGTARLLDSAGLAVKTFDNPDEFLDYAEAHRVPVAVIDVWMPQMNGLKVQSRLRDISPSTRVIIFTGTFDSFIWTMALEAGATAFFAKPFDAGEFLAAIRAACGGMNGALKSAAERRDGRLEMSGG